MIDDPVDASPGRRPKRAAGGPLSGLSCGKGFVRRRRPCHRRRQSGLGGGPRAGRTHAWAVARLLSAGADLAGKAITDEVSLGILGENAFFGTPRSNAAPGHVRGLLRGSAAAVAAGLVDTALGTDTGGSVRVPAGFCRPHPAEPWTPPSTA